MKKAPFSETVSCAYPLSGWAVLESKRPFSETVSCAYPLSGWAILESKRPFSETVSCAYPLSGWAILERKSGPCYIRPLPSLLVATVGMPQPKFKEFVIREHCNFSDTTRSFDTLLWIKQQQLGPVGLHTVSRAAPDKKYLYRNLYVIPIPPFQMSNSFRPPPSPRLN